MSLPTFPLRHRRTIYVTQLFVSTLSMSYCLVRKRFYFTSSFSCTFLRICVSQLYNTRTRNNSKFVCELLQQWFWNCWGHRALKDPLSFSPLGFVDKLYCNIPESSLQSELRCEKGFRSGARNRDATHGFEHHCENCFVPSVVLRTNRRSPAFSEDSKLTAGYRASDPPSTWTHECVLPTVWIQFIRTSRATRSHSSNERLECPELLPRAPR